VYHKQSYAVAMFMVPEQSGAAQRGLSLLINPLKPWPQNEKQK